MILRFCRGFFVSVLGLALLSGCALNPVTGRRELSLVTLSPEQELQMGREAFGQLEQQMDGRFDDPALERYINEVGDRLGRASHRPELDYRFTVLNASEPNAMALPGGFIGVTRGLLDALDNEAELAAVLGHEIGHVTARHTQASMNRRAAYGLAGGLLSAALSDTGYGAMAEKAGGLAASVMENSYSQDQEFESDRLGVDYMVRAGYSPQGAIQLQEYFYTQVEKGANSDWVSGLFRTHPFSIERLKAIRQQVQRQYAATGGDLGAARYQQATRKLKAAREAYQLYDQARSLEKQGQTAGALDLYHQAVAKGPDQARIHTALGLAYLRQEDLVPARRYLIKAVELDGNYYASRYGLGYVYLQKGQTAEAVTQLEKGMALLPTVQGAFLLAESYEKSGRTQDAYRLYQAVSQADSGRLGQAARSRMQQMAR